MSKVSKQNRRGRGRGGRRRGGRRNWKKRNNNNNEDSGPGLGHDPEQMMDDVSPNANPYYFGGDRGRGRGRGGHQWEKHQKHNNHNNSRQDSRPWSPGQNESPKRSYSGGRGRGRGGGRWSNNRKKPYNKNKRSPSQAQKQQHHHQAHVPAPSPMKNVTSPVVGGKEKRYYMTNELFSSLDIDEDLSRGISEILQYETMTRVQSQTIHVSLTGVDLLAQAKTGTGKTLAFLIPVVQLANKNRQGIKVLIVSPTRELANQICAEAKKLTYFYDTFRIHSMVGGTKKQKDYRAISQGISLLVATPRRLLDHLENTRNFNLQQVSILILDEADQMLEMGFRPDITKIISFLPRNRQSLLFSATVPPSLTEVCEIAVKPDFQYINTIPESEQHTHKAVPQSFITVPLDNLLTSVLYEIEREIQRNPQTFKMIVFFVTARLVGFMGHFLRNANLPVVEMHSRKSQAYRTKSAKQFRDGKKLVMVTSNVSARGVDYPDVSLVLQVGLMDRETYIHRLGRTARAQSSVIGHGVLLLHPFEKLMCLRNLDGLDIEEKTHDPENYNYSLAVASLRKTSKGINLPAAQAYSSWLGYYNTYLRKLKLNKQNLVDMAYELAGVLNAIDENGLPPAIEKRTVGKMNLKGVHGLNIVARHPNRNNQNHRHNHNNRGRGGRRQN